MQSIYFRKEHEKTDKNASENTSPNQSVQQKMFFRHYTRNFLKSKNSHYFLGENFVVFFSIYKVIKLNN